MSLQPHEVDCGTADDYQPEEAPMTDTMTPIEDVPFPGMPTPPNPPVAKSADVAPLPEQLDDVNADSLAQWLACHATERGALNFVALNRQNPAAFAHSQDALNAEWALCYVLRELPPNVADRLAREIWSTWDEGSGPYEMPPQWMAEYGMDPDALIGRVQSSRAGAVQP